MMTTVSCKETVMKDGILNYNLELLNLLIKPLFCKNTNSSMSSFSCGYSNILVNWLNTHRIVF